MPKRKNFNRRALSCTSTRTHLEGRRSVELRNLPFKPCPRKPRSGVSGALWRLPIGTDVVPLIYFLFSDKTRMRGYFLFTTALKGFPSFITYGQQYNFGEKPTVVVILYAAINHHVETPKRNTKRTLSSMNLEVQSTWTKEFYSRIQ